MSLRLLTLNIEGDRHLDRIAAVIARHRPDIPCLQEVFENDLSSLTAEGRYQAKFAATALVVDPVSGTARKWGVAALTRLPVNTQDVNYYTEDARIRIMRQPDDQRGLLLSTEFDHQGRAYRIVTTHFTWSAEGQISDRQIADFTRLKRVLSEAPHYVLCGDFNAPRGREMFSMFKGGLNLIDHLPADVTTTIDARYHRAGALELAVDTIFTTSDYHVHDVQVLDGVSDHKGILATVERR